MAGCKYEYQGVRGLPAISKLSGVPLGRLKSRVKRGYSIEDAVGYVMESKYVHNGLVGLREIAEAHNLTVSCIQARLKSGMSMEQALALPMNFRRHGASRLDTVPCKHPDLLSPTWKLALGIQA